MPSLFRPSKQKREVYMMRMTLAVVAVLFIAVNAIATNVFGARQVDLTANKLFTISEGTMRTLQSLDDVVYIRYYYSAEQATGLPAVQSYATRVRSLLQHYESISRGKVKVEVINPTPYSEVEDEAVKEGLQGIPVDSTGSRLYFGLYASGGTDKNASIPFFNPQRAAFLEYDLTKIIYDLAHPKKPVISVLSGLPMRLAMVNTPMQPDRDWAIITQLESFFDVRYINNQLVSIPKETDVLMVVHPDKLAEQALLILDQYLMAGHKVVIFTDPNAKVEGVRARKSDLNRILNKWGADMPTNEVVGDRSAAVRLPSMDGSSLLDTVANLTWLEISGWGFSRHDLITSELGLVRFITSGHYNKLPAETNLKKGELPRKTTWSPLITTSEDVMILDAQKVEDTTDTSKFMDSFKPTGKKQTLAVKITGRAGSAYPEFSNLKGYIPYSQEDSTLILVADTDILRNGLWVNKQQLENKVMYVPIADNGTFVMNALDYLAGSNDLISLRSRSDVAKTFRLVQDIKRKSEVQFRKKEKELENKAKSIEAELGQMKKVASGNNTNLPSKSQRDAITKVRENLINIRKELRNVRFQLRQEINKLSSIISFVNIALMPSVVILIALCVPFIRHRREREVV